MPSVVCNVEDECTRLRRVLRLSERATLPDGKHNAGVLILLDAVEPGNYKVFLNVRAETLRRHPGEVCFPGGMLEKADRDLQHTAVRETEEEVGLSADDYIVLGSMPAFRARFGITMHPTVALLKRKIHPKLNFDEVQRTFWQPLNDFLESTVHMAMEVEPKYTIHSFSFDEAHTYGVTALLCIVVAMGVSQKFPEFDLSPIISTVDYPTIMVDMAIDKVFENTNAKITAVSKL